MPDINSVPGEARGAQGASANAGEAQVSRQGSTTVSRRASQICEFISVRFGIWFGVNVERGGVERDAQSLLWWSTTGDPANTERC